MAKVPELLYERRSVGVSLVFGTYFGTYCIHLILFLEAIFISTTTDNQPTATAVRIRLGAYGNAVATAVWKIFSLRLRALQERHILGHIWASTVPLLYI